MDAGHHIEVVCRKQLAKWAREWKEENNWDVTVIESETLQIHLNFIKQVKKMHKELTERFIRYAKKETRSDETSQTVPTTPSQTAF